jgi:hypothetical protein
MASGFGVKGTRGRCHPFWMDFSKCMSDADTPSACAALREDYLECLHHRKEARASGGRGARRGGLLALLCCVGAARAWRACARCLARERTACAANPDFGGRRRGGAAHGCAQRKAGQRARHALLGPRVCMRVCGAAR